MSHVPFYIFYHQFLLLLQSLHFQAPVSHHFVSRSSYCQALQCPVLSKVLHILHFQRECTDQRIPSFHCSGRHPNAVPDDSLPCHPSRLCCRRSAPVHKIAVTESLPLVSLLPEPPVPLLQFPSILLHLFPLRKFLPPKSLLSVHPPLMIPRLWILLFLLFLLFPVLQYSPSPAL